MHPSTTTLGPRARHVVAALLLYAMTAAAALWVGRLLIGVAVLLTLILWGAAVISRRM